MVNEVRTALAASMTEAQLQKLVIERARELGWLVHHCRPAMNKKGEWRTHIQGDAGFPDLVLCRPPLVLFVELKSDTGKLSKEQKLWGITLWHAGADVKVWTPADWYSGLIEALLR